MNDSHSEQGSAGPAAPVFVIRYTYSFDSALEAGRFFQARLYRWYTFALVAGLLVGALVMIFADPVFGLTIVLFCATLLLMARFAAMDRLFGQRRVKGLLGDSMELLLSDEGVAWLGPKWSGHAPWRSITEVRANRRTVLFVGERILLAWAPAGAIGTAADQAKVLAYSRRQIEAAKASYRPLPPA